MKKLINIEKVRIHLEVREIKELNKLAKMLIASGVDPVHLVSTIHSLPKWNVVCKNNIRNAIFSK